MYIFLINCKLLKMEDQRHFTRSQKQKYWNNFPRKSEKTSSFHLAAEIESISSNSPSTSIILPLSQQLNSLKNSFYCNFSAFSLKFNFNSFGTNTISLMQAFSFSVNCFSIFCETFLFLLISYPNFIFFAIFCHLNFFFFSSLLLLGVVVETFCDLSAGCDWEFAHDSVAYMIKLILCKK